MIKSEFSAGTDNNVSKGLIIYSFSVFKTHTKKDFGKCLEEFDHDSEYWNAILLY